MDEAKKKTSLWARLRRCAASPLSATAIVCVMAVAVWAFFQWRYQYHFFYKEQQQLFLLSPEYIATYTGRGWLASLAGDFLTQYFYYRYAGAAILALLLLVLGLSLMSALRCLRVPWLLSAIIALVPMGAEAMFQLQHNFPLSATVAATGWSLALLLCAVCVRLTIVVAHSKATVRTRLSRLLPVLPAAGAVGVLLLAGSLFAKPETTGIKSPEWEVERLLAVESEYRFGNYDRVLSLVEQEAQPLPAQLFYYNLVLAQRGLLPDSLLRWNTPNNLGTLEEIGPTTPLYTIKNINELYWALGDMTYTERAAMMACVFSPKNRNVRMVKRLAETNIVSGDTIAARKYLRILSQTAAYSKWAATALNDPRYTRKALMRNTQDTLAVGDNSHFIMMQLLDSNPQNIVALDYMLCTELLLKDITNFKRDYDRYCAARPRTKRLYQEALCIWLAGTEAPQEQWQRLIAMPEVMADFRRYNQHRGDPAFKGTYWYYFDTTPTPQQP